LEEKRAAADMFPAFVERPIGMEPIKIEGKSEARDTGTR